MNETAEKLHAVDGIRAIGNHFRQGRTGEGGQFYELMRLLEQKPLSSEYQAMFGALSCVASILWESGEEAYAHGEAHARTFIIERVRRYAYAIASRKLDDDSLKAIEELGVAGSWDVTPTR